MCKKDCQGLCQKRGCLQAHPSDGGFQLGAHQEGVGVQVAGCSSGGGCSCRCSWDRCSPASNGERFQQEISSQQCKKSAVRDMADLERHDGLRTSAAVQALRLLELWVQPAQQRSSSAFIILLGIFLIPVYHVASTRCCTLAALSDDSPPTRAHLSRSRCCGWRCRFLLLW